MAKEKKVFRSKWIDLGNGRTAHVLQRSSLVDVREEQRKKRVGGKMIVKVINPEQQAEIQSKLRLETPAKVRGASPSGMDEVKPLEVDFVAYIGPVTPVK